MDLRDKVVLVTGGASGIGRATTLALAEAGAVVVVADLNEQDGAAVAEQVGGHFVRVDVSDLDSNRAMVDFAVERAGGIDGAFLNAGVATGCGIGDDFDLELYRRAMGVNVDGVVFGTQAVLPALRERGGGAIVATSSLAGLTGMPIDVIYNANKHAVVGFVRGLGPALAGDGIRVNAVCPGFAESALVEPLRADLAAAGFDIMPAEDVAAVVLELFRGDMAGECWFVQPGRTGAFEFRHVPGPRKAPAGD
jgi:NAD(P)-dependent dehydrogenase (short-subunit alcohol dehydrogenase family)